MGPKALVLPSCFPYNVSMKISKLLLLVCVVSVCVPAAFAQTARGLKYVPQAVKGAKAVPYVVKPNLSPVLRTNLAVPVARPNVATKVAPAVERAVAKKITIQNRIARLEKNFDLLKECKDYKKLRWLRREQIIDDLAYLVRNDAINYAPLYQRYLKLSQNFNIEQQIYRVAATQYRIELVETHLAKLEEYVRTHNNKLPTAEDGKEARKIRWEVSHNIAVLKRYYDLMPEVRENTSLFRRYEQLLEGNKQQREKERADANAATVATQAESNVPLKGNVVTDDYVEQLLNFYNKINPFGEPFNPDALAQ